VIGRTTTVDKRICSNCGSDETYVDKREREHWYNKQNQWFCEKCNNNLFKNPKWNGINKPRMINYKGIRLNVGFNLRKGICSWCGAVKGLNCKRTNLHHIEYHNDDPLKDTVELCVSCHMKEHH
jgi:hypothetical protein